MAWHNKFIRSYFWRPGVGNEGVSMAASFLGAQGENCVPLLLFLVVTGKLWHISQQGHVLRFWVYVLAGEGAPFNPVGSSSLRSYCVLILGLLVALVPWMGRNSLGRKGERIPCSRKSVSKGPQKRGDLSGVLMYEWHSCMFSLPHCP